MHSSLVCGCCWSFAVGFRMGWCSGWCKRRSRLRVSSCFDGWPSGKHRRRTSCHFDACSRLNGVELGYGGADLPLTRQQRCPAEPLSYRMKRPFGLHSPWVGKTDLADSVHPREHCTHCGAENDPQNSFCGSCGAPLASSPAGTTGGTAVVSDGAPSQGAWSMDRVRSLSTESMRASKAALDE
jgi:hypothetical protein